MRLTRSFVRSFLPARPLHSHKGTFGRVLVIAGSSTMSGAGVLCARAVLQSGAGLVCLALPKSCQAVAAAAVPESLTLALPEKDGLISARATSVLRKYIHSFQPSVILIGPGLSKAKCILPFLKQNTLPCVIDADALNGLSHTQKGPQILRGKFPLICTPHPGEMQRLLHKKILSQQEIRIQCAKELSRLTGGVSVLKGYHSVVTDGYTAYINPTGGPALAKAGTGDVLGGMIAGFWAQLGTVSGFTLQTALKAAVCGVYLHGLAADLAAKKWTDRCVLASDVTVQLPYAMKQVLRTANKS